MFHPLEADRLLMIVNSEEGRKRSVTTSAVDYFGLDDDSDDESAVALRGNSFKTVNVDLPLILCRSVLSQKLRFMASNYR